MDYPLSYAPQYPYLAYWQSPQTGAQQFLFINFGTLANNFHPSEYTEVQGVRDAQEMPVNLNPEMLRQRQPYNTHDHIGHVSANPSFPISSEKRQATRGNRLSMNPPESPARRIRNTESNICNQALAYALMPGRSENVLRRVLTLSLSENINEVCHLYYAYARVLKKYKRRYLTKRFLLEISTEFSCEVMMEVMNSRWYDAFKLPKSEFIRLLRILLWHFLGAICPLTIVTSKKIRKDLVHHHSVRRQQIRTFLLNKMSKKQDRG